MPEPRRGRADQALLGYLQGMRRQLSDDGGHGELSFLERAQA
jgi:hypothetical protein